MSKSSAVIAVVASLAAMQSMASQAPPSSPRLDEATIERVQALLRAKQVTCRALTAHYLARIDAYNAKGPSLNAVVTVNPRALTEADRLDAALASGGPVGALHCVPVLVKDQFETKDLVTTYGSVTFKGFQPSRDATAVAKLRDAGALIIGKGTMGEFASGYAGSMYGPIRNPYDPRRHPGGSSGGVGAGMAADFATIGLGEDTGGSVRAPAAIGSLVGHRPTTPLVSRHGVFPTRPSYDSTGPITRTVKDAAMVMDVIAGYDPKDPLTAYAVGQIPTTFGSDLKADALRGARLGVLRQPMHPTTDPTAADYRAIQAVLDRAIGELKARGAEVVEGLSIPDLSTRLSRIYDDNVFETEASVNAYFSELTNPPVKTLRELLLRPGGVLPWRARGLMGTVGRSTDEPGYGRVLRATEALRQEVLALMADRRLDAFVHTNSDHAPHLIAADIMTNPATDGDTRVGSNRTIAPVLGFPATTVPAGFTPDGLPVGIEFLGRAFADAMVLGYAYDYEQATKHRKPPSTTPPLR